MPFSLRLPIAALLLSVPAAGVAEVVLTRDGALIEGRVERQASGLTLYRSGGALHMPNERVATVAESRLAVYDWLREQNSAAPTPGARLRLAEWAMRHELWPQAALELIAARDLGADAEKLELLQRRLDLLSAPRTRVAAQEPVAPSASPPSVASIQQASYDQPAEPRLVVPRASLEEFTRRVQRILVNSCATVGCHARPSGVGFELDRALLHGHSDTRSTEHNLRAVLAAIDAGQPEQSPLLEAIRGMHAGVTPIEGPRADEIRHRLERWVADLLAANRPPDSGGGEAQEPQPLNPARGSRPVDAVTPDSIPPAEEKSAQEELVDVLDGVAEPERREERPRLRRVEPRDEFDPAIFNERHRRPQDDLPAGE